MSWIIQSLLNNSSTIREESNIDSDDFNDLILVEKAIKELRSKGLITDEEMEIIEFFRNSKADSSKPSKERHTLSSSYVKICDRVAYYLGDYFTNDGYLDYMQDKYKLTDGQVESLRNYMQSRYRHMIVRKTKSNHKEPIND